MKKFNALISIILAVMMTLFSFSPVLALTDADAENYEARATHLNFDEPSASVTYSNAKIIGKVTIQGTSTGVSFYDGTVSIQRRYGLIWIDIEEWTGLSATGRFNFYDNSITPADGKTYRIKYNVKTSYNGNTETASGSSSAVAYNP